MAVTFTPMPELNRKAFAVLCREFGVAEAIRFFGQLGLGSGNYTEERKELLKDVTNEDVRKGIEELRKQRSHT